MPTPTSIEQIKDRLASILSDKFGLPEDETRSGATFEELDIDSLITVELALILRKEVAVVVEEGEIKASFTLDDAAALIESKGPKL
ncbi:phosphopantetheine-binding protein [Streptomyces amakusaensis]|uniref:Phosphopantetheine-binding protein n=1 Tax=Streptomyces amakusaensis TaxID=67271 RepID=A0ABW0AE87_9ACTN